VRASCCPIRCPQVVSGDSPAAPYNEKPPLLRGFLEEPTPGFEPGTPSLRVNRVCPKGSPVGLYIQRVSVSSTPEGTRLDNRMRPIYGPRSSAVLAARCRLANANAAPTTPGLPRLLLSRRAHTSDSRALRLRAGPRFPARPLRHSPIRSALSGYGRKIVSLLLVVGIILLIIAIAGGAIVHPLLFALAIVALVLFFAGR
jgi:hypothetical protein